MIFDSARDGGLRLGTDEIDQAFVLHRAVEDPRLLDDEERCGIFENMVKWSSALSVEQYAEIADGACRAYPLDSRLPFGSISHMNATVAN
jgi:hypothetical protein